VSDDRVGQFETDIAGSADALVRLLDGWRSPGLELEGRRVVFVGLGSSRYAADVIAPLARAQGLSAWVETAGPGSTTPPADDLTVVAISASGGTREVVAAAARHRGRSRVVALTARPDSALAAEADDVIALESGEEAAGIACRSFRATIAALALIIGVASVERLRPAVKRVAARLQGRERWLGPLVSTIGDSTDIDVLADGPSLGVADQGALMLREAPRIAAHAASTTDWLHTGVYLAWPGRGVVLFPGSPADEDVMSTVLRRGAALATVPRANDEPVVRAIVDSVVLECAALELWRGVDADEAAEA
jgi:fructoselysine-6-P-deglycase FrlB-like protein